MKAFTGIDYNFIQQALVTAVPVAREVYLSRARCPHYNDFTIRPTFRTTKCSIEEGVRRQPTPRPSPSQEGETEF
ncbi:hypothetical protein [Okeania sp. SIO2B3]|uniref:hypothetical protein n=1 Tax=Okeania sp. SIO2B3 TaxID=2607784 RepID=UPI0013BFA524|nr:hypothetical protein [Okeania sp. SIO2B3]NET43470.1 hypothetical protein [Okeania sp. SIO2B3]